MLYEINTPYLQICEHLKGKIRNSIDGDILIFEVHTFVRMKIVFSRKLCLIIRYIEFGV
jgi:hypothetical protein